MQIHIDESVTNKVPDFKLGIIKYHDIAVQDSPQMLKGRFALFQEEIMLSLEEKNASELSGVKEWRQTFKKLGIDPSRYRPSHEALFRRLKKGQSLPTIHSAADVNNFFSLRFEIPAGIYDLNTIEGPLTIKMGDEQDKYDGINGREMSMNGKLTAVDQKGAFGSPLVDSKRTMTTEATTSALHILYLKPSMSIEEAKQLIASVVDMFSHVHGGSAEHYILSRGDHIE